MIKTLLSAAIAVTLVAGAAAPAFADPHDWREREWHERERRDRAWHDREWRIHHPYYAAPPVVVAPPPQAYYAPPPVVAPAPIAPSINIVVPLHIH